MEKDFQSIAHSVVSKWIRFWFPWVRLLEQDSVGDESWRIEDEKKLVVEDEKKLVTEGLHPKDIVWVAFHETIPQLKEALRDLIEESPCYCDTKGDTPCASCRAITLLHESDTQ